MDLHSLDDPRDVMPDASLGGTEAGRPHYVNYMDVKLERVIGVPPAWYDAVDAPAYHQHPFRYEVSLVIPRNTAVEKKKEDVAEVAEAKESPRDRARSTLRCSQGAGAGNGTKSSNTNLVAPPVSATVRSSAVEFDGKKATVTFTHGRLLQPLPVYQHYINTAEAERIPGMDEVCQLRDIPEALEPPEASALAATEGAGGEGNIAGTVGSEMPDPTATLPLPVILWVANDVTDAPPAVVEEAPLDKKRKRVQSTSFAPNTTAGITETAAPPPPSVPEKGTPAPCVLRIPLDSEQEEYVEYLLNNAVPLELVFRRVLKPGAPSEWEDLNAAFYEATVPISLAPLAEPGSQSLTTQTQLKPRLLNAHEIMTDNERFKRKSAARRSKSGMPLMLYEDIDASAPHPYIAHDTAMVVSIRLQRTLTRLASDRIRPTVTPAQLIPTHRRRHKAATVGHTHDRVDPTKRFATAVEEMASKLIRDYKSTANDALLRTDATAEEREAWRSRFLDYFQSTGQLAAYKQQLAPLVSDIVRERFLRDPGVSKSELSLLSNELYVYLVDCMHASLQRSLSLEPSPASGQSEQTPASVPENDGDADDDTWKLRAIEAEASQDYAVASKYYQARVASCDDPDRLPAIWTDTAEFYIRVGDAAKAEQCYREAIACDPQYAPALLGYGMWLMSYERLNEAAVFLHGFVDLAPQDPLAWGCVALLDDLWMLGLKEGSPTFHSEMAKWQKEHRYTMMNALKYVNQSMDGDLSGAVREPLPGAEVKPPNEHDKESIDGEEEDSSGSPAVAESNSAPDIAGVTAAATGIPVSSLSPERAEEIIYLGVARYALRLHHHSLANICLARCTAGSEETERIYARVFVQAGQYEDALATLNELQGTELRERSSEAYKSLPAYKQMEEDELLVLRAHCYVALGQMEDAVRCYKSALCKDNTSQPPYMAVLQRQSRAGDAAGIQTELFPSVPAQLLAAGTPVSALYAQLHLFFSEAYLRLGNLLIAEGKYRDTLGVFTLGIETWPCGLMWLGAGIAYYRIGNYEAAEECLNESNICNPLNPRTWGYLALLCMRTRRVEIEEVLQHVMRQGLLDAALWAEIGRELLHIAARPLLGEICLRKAIALEAENQNQQRTQVGSSLTCVSKYHLSHALMDMQRWEEAQQKLLEVSQESGNEVLRAKAEEELRQLRNGCN